MRELSVVIPAAGLGRRMKSYGPKALIEIARHETIISRQIAIIRECLPTADIVVVVGFEADKIARLLPSDIMVVENENYAQTNVARSLEIGLRACPARASLIVYGDLVFNRATLRNIRLDRSQIWIDTKGSFHAASTVGVNVHEGKVVHYAYGLPTKWAQIALLTGLELHLFRTLLARQDYRRHYGFEILLELVDLPSVNFWAIEPPCMQISEVDTVADIAIARRIAIEGNM